MASRCCQMLSQVLAELLLDDLEITLSDHRWATWQDCLNAFIFVALVMRFLFPCVLCPPAENKGLICSCVGVTIIILFV